MAILGLGSWLIRQNGIKKIESMPKSDAAVNRHPSLTTDLSF